MDTKTPSPFLTTDQAAMRINVVPATLRGCARLAAGHPTSSSDRGAFSTTSISSTRGFAPDSTTLRASTKARPHHMPDLKALPEDEFEVAPFFREEIAPDYVVAVLTWRLYEDHRRLRYSSMGDEADRFLTLVSEALGSLPSADSGDTFRSLLVVSKEAWTAWEDRPSEMNSFPLRQGVRLTALGTAVVITDLVALDAILSDPDFRVGDDAARYDYESALEWAKRLAVPDDVFAGTLRQLARCNYDLGLLAKMRSRRSAGKPEFLVPGLLPRGCVSLLVGERKAGKSTIVTELATVAASGGGEWCGFTIPAEACEGLAMLFCGEDPEAIVVDRLSRMGVRDSDALIPFANSTGDVFAELDLLRDAPVSLVVVDPARKYFRGDEDGSDAVSTFVGQLEEFAGRKNCAVLLTHHPRKGGRPTSLADLVASARGSSVFLDRPRVLLGLLRQGDETIMGIPTMHGSPMHNFPGELMFAGQRRLRRDAETHQHLAVDGSRPEVEKLTAKIINSVRSVAREELTCGRHLTKSGKSGLFERQDPRLKGVARKTVHAAVDHLVDLGELIATSHGLELSTDTDKVLASVLD